MDQVIKDLAKAYVVIEKQQVVSSKMADTFDKMKLDIVKAASEMKSTEDLFKEISNQHRGM